MNLKELLAKHGIHLYEKNMETAQKIADELTKPLKEHHELFKNEVRLKLEQKDSLIGELNTTVETKNAEIDTLRIRLSRVVDAMEKEIEAEKATSDEWHKLSVSLAEEIKEKEQQIEELEKAQYFNEENLRNMTSELDEKERQLHQNEFTIDGKNAAISNNKKEIERLGKRVENLETQNAYLEDSNNHISKELHLTMGINRSLSKQLTATNTVMGYLRKLISKFSWGRKNVQ